MNSPLARDYDAFIALLNDRRIELSLPFTSLNDLAELPGGYSQKLISGARKKGSYNAIGPQALEKLLKALSVGIRLEPISDCSDISRDKMPDLPHLRLLRERSRKAGRKSYEQMNSVERLKFARAGGIASGLARRKAALARKKKLSREKAANSCGPHRECGPATGS